MGISNEIRGLEYMGTYVDNIYEVKFSEHTRLTDLGDIYNNPNPKFLDRCIFPFNGENHAECTKL